MDQHLAQQRADSVPHIPVTLLTGFLGAGKTTLLNHLLKNPGKEKFAVIVNEFGQVGIDGELIVRSDETMIELSNGCVCCTVRTDLVKTLTELLEKQYGVHGQAIQPFTRILIETTGLADPVPLIQTFAMDDLLQKFFSLEQVVAVVDAKHFEKVRRFLPLAEEQVAFADSIILNKQDLVSEEDTQALQAELRTLNPLAQIYSTTHGQVALEDLFHSSHPDSVLRILALQQGAAHEHTSRIGAISLSAQKPLDQQRFVSWIDDLIASCGPDIYRYKGVVWCEAWPDRRAILQGVHVLYSFEPDRLWRNTEEPITRLVLIGRDLNEKHIRESFALLEA